MAATVKEEKTVADILADGADFAPDEQAEGEPSSLGDLGFFGDEDGDDTDSDTASDEQGDGEDDSRDDNDGSQDDTEDDAIDSDADDEDSGVEEGDDEDSEGDESAEADNSAQEETISVEAYMAAAQYGLTKEQADAFGNDRALMTALSMLQGTQQGTAETGQKEPEDDKPPVIEFDFGDEELDDEKLVGELKKQAEVINKFVQSQHEQNKQLTQRLEEQRLQREIDMFENALGRLEEFQDEVGSGTLEEVGPAQQEARIKIFEKVQQIKNMNAQLGKTQTINQLVDEATSLVFKDKLKSNTKKAIVKEAKKRTKVRKPSTSRDGEIADDDDSAIAHIAGMLKDMGKDPKMYKSSNSLDSVL